MGWKRKVFILITFLLLGANFFVWKEIFNLDGNLNIIFFDVGQGDAIFIETPQGHQVLIDGGPSKKILEKLALNVPFWDDSLDLVILSHPEADHLRGLNYVLERYKVENILWNGVKKDTETFENWQENLEKEREEEKTNIIIAQRGQRIKAGKTEIFVLFPFQSLEDEFFKGDTNNTSVVVKLLFSKTSFLFTGDISEKVEKELITEDPSLSLNSQVLKVAHHGSKSSTSRDFLKTVKPEIAVISCGINNPYGHPSQDALSNLQEFGINILNTSQMGDIKLISDGAEIYLR